MTPRQAVTDLLKGNLPDGIVVLPYALDGIVPALTTIMLRVDTVARVPQAPMSHGRYTDV